MNPDYSIIIPAYNEVDWLPRTLAAVQAAMAAVALRGEVVVCDNNSSDDTAAVAAGLGARVVFEPHNQISRARNSGARAAQGRYLIFVDADTLISAPLLQSALDRLESGACCGGGAVVTLDSLTTRIERLGLWLWNQVSRRLRLAAGCFIFCRRDDFEAVGGFSEAVYASEELWLSRQLHRRGRRRGQAFCILRDHPVHSSGRKAQWFGPVRQFMLVLLLVLFPFLVRWKRFCSFWYRRPGDN